MKGDESVAHVKRYKLVQIGPRPEGAISCYEGIPIRTSQVFYADCCVCSYDKLELRHNKVPRSLLLNHL